MVKIKILLLFLFTASTLFAQEVQHVHHVSYTVSDLDEAIDFLKENVDAKLNYKKTTKETSLQNLMGVRDADLSLEMASVQIGDSEVRLLEFDASEEGREIPRDSKSNDLWFLHIAIVVNDMDAAYDQVHDNKVTHVSTAPQTLPDYIPAAAGISAFYFQDEDDHNLELIYFPEDKGNPKWQKKTDRTFLGIDHTAIGIEDTDISTTFYQDILGLEVAGHSENYGTEQEHLNQVFGARLFITGLTAEKGFGVEFLEYIAPSGGRSYPIDSTPLDLWYWHIAMQVDDIEGLLEKVQKHNYDVVSHGISSVEALGYDKAVIVRDPDNHAILLYESAK